MYSYIRNKNKTSDIIEDNLTQKSVSTLHNNLGHFLSSRRFYNVKDNGKSQ